MDVNSLSITLKSLDITQNWRKTHYVLINGIFEHSAGNISLTPDETDYLSNDVTQKNIFSFNINQKDE